MKYALKLHGQDMGQFESLGDVIEAMDTFIDDENEAGANTYDDFEIENIS